MSGKTTRRDFLARTSTLSAAIWVSGRPASASKSPNEKLNIAAIGCGGKGRTDIRGCLNENIIALCDCDDGRAAETYKLGYADLKQLVRTGMEHSFLPGADLWSKPDEFGKTSAVCAKDTLGTEKPSKPCAGFLKDNEKARQQWELERRFRVFEETF